MDFKNDLRALVDFVKNQTRDAGGRLTNEEIAKRLGYGRTYFSSLLGESGRVEQKHIENFKAHFKDELRGVANVKPGDTMNPEKALFFAFLQDYAEWKADVTGQSFAQVKSGIKQKGRQILEDFDSWLP